MRYKRLTTIFSILLFTVVFSNQSRATPPCGVDGAPACEVPEPSSIAILTLGLVGLAAARIKKK